MIRIAFEFERKPHFTINILCIETNSFYGSLFLFTKESHIVSWDFLYFHDFWFDKIFKHIKNLILNIKNRIM